MWWFVFAWVTTGSPDNPEMNAVFPWTDIIESTNHVSQLSVLDISTALAAMGGDREVFGQTVSMYLEIVPKLLGRMDDALLHGERSVIRNHAHTIKSSSRTIGGMLLGDTAERIEELSERASDLLLSNTVQQLHSLYGEMESMLVAAGYGRRSLIEH